MDNRYHTIVEEYNKKNKEIFNSNKSAKEKTKELLNLVNETSNALENIYNEGVIKSKEDIDKYNLDINTLNKYREIIKDVLSKKYPEENLENQENNINEDINVKDSENIENTTEENDKENDKESDKENDSKTEKLNLFDALKRLNNAKAMRRKLE